jgi:hypothetical protein
MRRTKPEWHKVLTMTYRSRLYQDNGGFGVYLYKRLQTPAGFGFDELAKILAGENCGPMPGLSEQLSEQLYAQWQIEEGGT